MSIAIKTHRARVQAPARPFLKAATAERPVLSQREQLKDMRGLMRHFVLAFMTAGAGLYAIAAAGIGL